MLDSGAFTAWTRGKPIDINAYCAYIDKHQADINEYIVLDDPEKPDRTLLNLLTMESKGYRPLPVFSFGAPWYHLDWLTARYDRIALGGCVPKTNAELKAWLTDVFQRYPNKRFHILGITRPEVLNRFPLESADSTSWITRWHKGAKIRASTDRRKEQVFRAQRMLRIAENGGTFQQSMF